MRTIKHLYLAMTCIVMCVSCEMSTVKKAIEHEVEEYGLEVKKIELQKAGPGVYDGKVYLERSILGLINIIPIEAEKVNNEWVVSLDY